MRGTSYLTGFFSGFFDESQEVVTDPDGRSIIEQCRSLVSARGESSTLRIAGSILATYKGLSAEGRLEFFRYLATELDLDAAEVMRLAETYRDAPDPKGLAALAAAAEPERQQLFRKLNQVDGATTHLVSMRRDLLDMMRDHPELGGIDLDFAHLFSSWFNRGFLMLHEINWDTPAVILEKIIAYEAVHEINDWNDLRRRTQPSDRRCFGYFHPCMPDDPLIFVEVALTKGVPVSIQQVLAGDRAPIRGRDADTAVFYSISNCQRGLKGISFGNSLIKHVVAALEDDLPNLKTFITLSPIPGLSRWLSGEAEQGNPRAAGLCDAMAASGDGDTPPGLTSAGQDLRELAAHYLASERRSDGTPRDNVARFHLSNGARIENVLAGADISPNGLRQSCGAMVNYRYARRHVESRSENFATDHTITLSRQVRTLARAGAPGKGKRKNKGA